MTAHITLVTGKADPGCGIMLVESLGKGILAHVRRPYQVRNG